VPAQGTPRAFEGRNQISRAQSRANSGTPAVINGNTLAEEIGPAEVSGKVQATSVAASRDNWLVRTLDDAGIAGAGCEPDAGCVVQQGMTPWRQQAGSGCLAHVGDGVCASRNGVPASTRQQMMAQAVFIF